jgi:hypothetical protein
MKEAIKSVKLYCSATIILAVRLASPKILL